MFSARTWVTTEGTELGLWASRTTIALPWLQGYPHGMRREATPRQRLRYGLRLMTAPSRVLPDFIMIGAQKSATTTAYNQLATHPSIEPSIWKETRFFDTPLFDRGPLLYRARFPSFARMALTRRRHGVARTGEATPTYLFHPHAARRAAELVPDCRLLVILRDPVKRAISDYAMNRGKHGIEPLSFLEALHAEEERLAPDRARLARGEHPSDDWISYSYAAKGLYAEQLATWTKCFPREQLHVVTFNELKDDPVRVYDAMAAHIGVGPHAWDIIPARNKARLKPEAPDEALALLHATFAEPNQRLYDEWGIDFRQS